MSKLTLALGRSRPDPPPPPFLDFKEGRGRKNGH